MKINLSISLIILFMAFYHVASAQNWKLTGNAATSPATDFLGTTDTKGLAFRTNNIERMRVSNSGRIGIGTISPAYFMHVFGTTQIENNSKTIYDEPLFSIRSSAANGPTSNPSIAFKVEDTTFALMGYDCSTKDIILSTKEPLYVPNLVINHANGFTGLNSKTPAAQLDINSNSFDDALRVQVDSSTKLFVGDRGGVSIGAYVQGPTNGLYVAGNTGLGITQPVYRLDVTGTSRFSGNVGIQTVPGPRTLQVGANLGSLLGIGTDEFIQDFGTSTLATNNDWIPITDNIRELGHADRRWKDIWSVDGTINTSDARDKTNIRDLNYGLKEIMQLHSVKFNWKNNAEAGDKLGVIAQEIQKVLPEVVRDWDYKTIDETSGKKEKVPAERLGVMYADIIPVLIKGMQEQQKEIEDLKQTIQQLNNAQLNALPSAKIIAGNAVSLQQNIPNPVKNFTSINYNIGNSKNAQLNITDATGNVRKQIQLNKESTTLRVDCSMLLAGTYFYTLVIDGKEADSKKMIVEK